jgi:hypothetical protein
VHEGVQGVFVAVVREGVAEGFAEAGGDFRGAAGGEGAAPGGRACAERVEHGVEQRSQGVLAVGA